MTLVTKTEFNGFVKACDAINKVSTESVIASNGVFMWMTDSGSLSILTLHEKIEKNMIPFLIGRYHFHPKSIIFMAKYFDLHEIAFDDERITLTFTSSDLTEALADKSAEEIFKLLEVGGSGMYNLHLNKLRVDDYQYSSITSILHNIHNNADFDKSSVVEDLDKTILMKGDKPITIDQDGFFVRIAKSVFHSVNSSDKVSLRLTPYTNTDSTFLCTATVSKDHCHLINIFNALHI